MANQSDGAGQDDVQGKKNGNGGQEYLVVNIDEQGGDEGEIQMSSAADGQRVVPLWKAKELMTERIRKVQAASLRGNMVGRRMIRIQVKVGGFGVEQSMLWLRAQPSFPRTFFLNEDSSLLSAGAGSAHTICGSGELKEDVVNQDMPSSFRYYGGSRFDAGAEIKKEWAAFGGHYFVLPKIELLCESGAAAEPKSAGQRADSSSASWRCGERDSMQGFTFAVNMKVEDDSEWDEEFRTTLQAVDDMAVALSREKTLPAPTAMWEGTKFESWKQMIDEALGQMQDGQLRKVVLSRNYFVQFPSEIEPLDLLLKLRTHHGYIFCLEPERGSAFLGCSPEPLFRISQDGIETMAISGTRPRGDTEQRDKALAEELLASDKDMYENGVTTKYIQQLLGEVAQEVETSEVFVMKLRHVQHICRKIRARASFKGGPASTPQGLLLALNPTPAVCGESRPAATEFIRRSEGFDRGFFGGPVGFLSSTACEFLVAIRSVLCEPRMLHVYAGAGIVPGSDAHSEWDETRLKMRNILLLVNKPQLPLRQLPNINVVPCPPPPALLAPDPAACDGAAASTPRGLTHSTPAVLLMLSLLLFVCSGTLALPPLGRVFE